jgi:hypothetical protein
MQRVGFILTNLETPSRAVVRFYNKRGTAEQWIKEGKQAVKMTRLSCHRFRSNQVRRAATAGGALVGLQSGDGSVELSNSILVKNVAASGAAFAGNGVTFINTTLADNDGPAVSAMASVASLSIASGPIGPQPIRFHNTIVSGGKPLRSCRPGGPVSGSREQSSISSQFVCGQHRGGRATIRAVLHSAAVKPGGERRQRCGLRGSPHRRARYLGQDAPEGPSLHDRRRRSRHPEHRPASPRAPRRRGFDSS